MIALTKDVGDEFAKNSLYRLKKIYNICIKPEFDKHIFKICKVRPSNDYYRF